MRLARFIAGVLNRVGLMKLLGNGWPVSGIEERDTPAAGLARARFDGAEIAAQNGLCGHETGGLGRSSARSSGLKSVKQENLVFANGTADRSPELIAAKSVLRRREEVARIEVAVAHELEQVAVDLVGAGFGNRIHHGVGMQAVARRDTVGLTLNSCNASGKGNGRFTAECVSLWWPPSSR
jgi:hypothetical protein